MFPQNFESETKCRVRTHSNPRRHALPPKKVGWRASVHDGKSDSKKLKAANLALKGKGPANSLSSCVQVCSRIDDSADSDLESNLGVATKQASAASFDDGISTLTNKATASGHTCTEPGEREDRAEGPGNRAWHVQGHVHAHCGTNPRAGSSAIRGDE